MAVDEERISKFLSMILRHKPEAIGLELDASGWADVQTLLDKANAGGHALSRDAVEQVVANSDKKRFVFSDDGQRIRANQGHSITVDLGLAAIPPPALLFHGTATRFLAAIRSTGLTPQSRQSVHLSASVDVALSVGKRHGTPVVLTVHAQKMHAAGHPFYLSANGVWLTAAVPPQFLE